MRAARAIREALGRAVDQLMTVAEVAEKRAQARHDDTLAAVEKIQPAQVDLDQAMADRIVEKIHGPLTIPQHFSDWIREQAKFREVMRIDPLGYGPNPGTSRYVLKSNGTMFWEFQDLNGATLWQATFVPPDFGKEQRG